MTDLGKKLEQRQSRDAKNDFLKTVLINAKNIPWFLQLP